ncbi:Protein CBG07876 [Caenorhabditis briggsae]|uniref:Protein CBG07876 n=1 Tax=Caenorhabditis briggsae TaxID=6238 RepID=A8X5B8_CAEBR|nr:Protein CBG07876 [Caenorhabditis briggsae]CAP27817.2 Protein CBG07876 [Caenorhabditis briggsae]
MPVVLYPVLRSILEHMEANCRFSLSGRCPEISRVEKSVPLRVKTILFSDNTFSINNIKYKVFFEIPRMRIMYTLLPIRMPNHPLTMRIYHFNTKVFAEKKFSRNYGIEEALRKVMEYFFGGRSNIHVQCVTVFDNGLSNLKVSVLENSVFGVPIFHPIVQRSPLKELHIDVCHPNDFENPLVRTAEKIIIMDYDYEEPDNWLETHRDLPNKEVIIRTYEHGFTNIKILDLIEYWRKTRRAIESSFSILKSDRDSIEKLMENIKERFQGTCEEVKVTNTKTFFDINAVSIQIDSESKIVVYGGKTYYWSEVVSKVVIKVMAVGSSAEIQKEETEPLEEPKIVPRKPFNYFAIVIPLLTLLIAYFFWLHLFLEHIHHLTPSD